MRFVYLFIGRCKLVYNYQTKLGDHPYLDNRLMPDRAVGEARTRDPQLGKLMPFNPAD